MVKPIINYLSFTFAFYGFSVLKAGKNGIFDTTISIFLLLQRSLINKSL